MEVRVIGARGYGSRAMGVGVMEGRGYRSMRVGVMGWGYRDRGVRR